MLWGLFGRGSDMFQAVSILIDLYVCSMSIPLTGTRGYHLVPLGTISESKILNQGGTRIDPGRSVPWIRPKWTCKSGIRLEPRFGAKDTGCGLRY